MYAIYFLLFSYFFLPNVSWYSTKLWPPHHSSLLQVFSCLVESCMYFDMFFFFLFCCRRARSQSCPFCRDSLKRVNSGDLWIFTDSRDIVDMETVTRENLRRLFMYIDKLPLIIPESLFDPYDSHLR